MQDSHSQGTVLPTGKPGCPVRGFGSGDKDQCSVWSRLSTSLGRASSRQSENLDRTSSRQPDSLQRASSKPAPLSEPSPGI